MIDRSSRPAHTPQATAASIAERIVALRRQRWTGSLIAHEVDVSPANVSRVLKRAGLSRLPWPQPPKPVYHHASPKHHFSTQRPLKKRAGTMIRRLTALRLGPIDIQGFRFGAMRDS
jgi:hypothetical protein